MYIHNINNIIKTTAMQPQQGHIQLKITQLFTNCVYYACVY